jgi:phage head maturation protease
MPQTWIRFGEALKALGNGRVGGWLVRYSTEADPDLTNDFFTPATDFDREFPCKVSVYYAHGLDKTLGKTRLTTAELKAEDAGIWGEAQLELANQYQAKIYSLVEAGKLGWSSGSVGHLVDREPVGKAFRLSAWPIAEASLTPEPAEPRNLVVSLKSYQDSVKSLLDFEQDNPQAIAERERRAQKQQAAIKAATAAAESELLGESLEEDMSIALLYLSPHDGNRREGVLPARLVGS